MSLVNSQVPEQRQRGVALLERGDFLQPDSMKVRPTHPAAPDGPWTACVRRVRRHLSDSAPRADGGRSTWTRCSQP
jgi:hypothetical protein